MTKDTDLDFKQLSQRDHVCMRPNMYVGSTEPQNIEMYILSDENKFKLEAVCFSPAFLKCVDEIIVNAVDHYVRNPKKVTQIDINFDIKKGTITVKNDGPGIPIKLVDTLNDGKKYQPEAIFSQFLSGSNFSEDDRVTGGMNGLGAKLANIFSQSFVVETRTKTKLYKQTFKDRLNIIEQPEIVNITDNSAASSGGDYTKIRFLPNYEALGYKEYSEKIAKTLYKIIEARAYQAAVFVNCAIFFNKKLVEVTKFNAYAEMFLEDPELYTTTIFNADKSASLEICIGVSDGKFRQVSLLNGIYVYMGGTHIKHIQNEIVENLKSKVEKELNKSKSKFNSNFIINNLFLFVKGSIVNPEFNSQSKEKLTTSIDKFKDYKFKPKEWKAIWELLEVPIMSSILGKIKDKKQTRINRGAVILEKGEDAKFAADRKKAVACTLVICEGDSALGMVTRGINHKKTELQKDYYGTFSIQGVPINARKESNKIVDKKTGNVHMIRNEKLKNNKRFVELVKILGLDYEKKYDKLTDAGRQEFATLRYGRVVIAVDQDEDGKGQIFGLLMNFFMYFWPALSEWGFVKRFNTPIIRAYPKNGKGTVKEFTTLFLYRKWIAETFNGDDVGASATHKIKYYKGLASHDVGEIRPMFKKFEDKLYSFEFDEAAEEHLEIYFGKDTDPRKKALSSPVSNDDEIRDEINISISRLMRTDVKEFQRDNILRKLPHIMDGLVPARRKAFFTARSVELKETKVCNFTGVVISKTNYHHGDASLSETIIKMAQNFVGARNLPLLIGVGEFGSRLMGGKDHGSPRYVFVKLNKKLTDILYPKCDDFILPYQFDEGERCEPVYYIPILPTAIMENMSIPATGWKAEIWAHDYKSIIKNVRNMINGEIVKCKSLQIWLRGNNSEIRHGSDNNIYIVGKYKYCNKTNTLTITELPPGIYNGDYIKTITGTGKDEYKPDFKTVSDHSNYDEETNIDEIDIRFELMPGVMEKWKSVSSKSLSKDPLQSLSKDPLQSLSKDTPQDSICDPIEKVMGLCVKVNSHINMIMCDGRVKTFKYYSNIVNEWFIMRKNLYKERICRMTSLSKLMIRYLENIIRFTKERENYNITNKTPENEFNRILVENKYDTFDKIILFSPKYTAIDELEQLIINNPAKGTSYEYIISLTYRQLLNEASIKREEELKREKQFLADLYKDSIETNGCFIGQKTWLKELDELEKVIDNGICKGWKETKHKPIFE